jgi:3-hydroxyisobutyrate dehydrogenase-like beta-hydroxyacid dehydrogenase
MFKEKMSPLGMSITVLEGEAGSAATHKLVRSIVYKGIAAVVMECLEAADELNLGDYARTQMMTILRDESLIDRFVGGSIKHAGRRIHEMEAVIEMLDSIGVSAFTSRAALEKLKKIKEQ